MNDAYTKDWVFTDYDRELIDRELQDFIPPRVFDAHVHLFLREHFLPDQQPPLFQNAPDRLGVEEFRKHINDLMPGREVDGLFFAFPKVGIDLEAANSFVASEVAKQATLKGQMLITPEMDPEYIRQTVRDDGFAGLKCYHVFAPLESTFEATIEDFLPEPQVRIAHEEGLSITLHIMRSQALADTGNQETIRTYCQRYPNMRLILAHAARGFNPHHTVQGIDALVGLDNVWCDTSAVTDCGAMEVIINRLGHERLLYGSDFPVTHIRGRCVGIGDTFVWFYAKDIPREVMYGNVRPTLVGIESLRALKVAAMATRLTDSQIEDVFYNNAAALYDIPKVGPRAGAT